MSKDMGWPFPGAPDDKKKVMGNLKKTLKLAWGQVCMVEKQQSEMENAEESKLVVVDNVMNLEHMKKLAENMSFSKLSSVPLSRSAWGRLVKIEDLEPHLSRFWNVPKAFLTRSWNISPTFPRRFLRSVEFGLMTQCKGFLTLAHS